MGYTISPTELKTRLDRGDQLVLLDVREQWEYDLAKLNGSTLIPLATLPHSLGKLNRDAEIIAICHHGMRSADATNFLLQQGFSKVKKLVGGIDAWSRTVDERVPRYEIARDMTTGRPTLRHLRSVVSQAEGCINP